MTAAARASLWLLALSGACAASHGGGGGGGEDEPAGPPAIAGAWLVCVVDGFDVQMACRPPEELGWDLSGEGWYFPADGGPLLRVTKDAAGACLAEAPLYASSTWVEYEQEGDVRVSIDNVRGLGNITLFRLGDLLGILREGLFTEDTPEYGTTSARMRKGEAPTRRCVSAL